MADCTSSMAETMSRPHSKLIETSALPRLVVERMLRTPGTARTASSTGQVTSIAIRSAGRSPASRLTAIRGKLTLGNRPTGRRQAAPHSGQGEGEHEKQDRAMVGLDPLGELHGPDSTCTAMPSCSSALPWTTTS